MFNFLFLILVSLTVLAIPLFATDGVSTDPNDIGFYLFPNASNAADYDKLEYLDPDSITQSRYSTCKKSILLTHGYTQNFQSDFPTVLIKAYLDAGYAETTNIIAVDWGKLSGRFADLPSTTSGLLIVLSSLYLEVSDNVPCVGKRIQEFICFLQKNNLLSGPSEVHLVGHSIGAHASGMAGMYYKESTGASLDRITGTDPAGEVFQHKPSDERLDASDANFVDIVYTNQGELGFLGPLGHVNFFVNGGGPNVQPGCPPKTLFTLFCSHTIAPRYYAKSIGNTDLVAQAVSIIRVPGRGTAIFGEGCPHCTRGFYNIEMVLPQAEIPLRHLLV